MQTPADNAVAMSVNSDWRPTISKLDRPLLVACEPPLKAMAADPITAIVASARVELFPDAGHALFVDDADHFNTVLDDFLQHLAPGSR
jgi:non-heme chloroperoxidase